MGIFPSPSCGRFALWVYSLCPLRPELVVVVVVNVALVAATNKSSGPKQQSPVTPSPAFRLFR
eukprot:489313-Prorocentrum_minimum.AAC.1